MSNTIIQVKRSQNTSIPSSLEYGELAYSFQSQTLTIGDQDTSVVVIGGNNFTEVVNSATSSNTINTLVKRDSSGNFSASNIYAELQGNSASTTKWKNSRLIGVSGDASGQVSVDGTANANVPLTLATVNSNIGTFGGTTSIPTFTVNEKGLLTSVANVSIATTLSISGDSGTDEIHLLNDALKFVGGDGITSAITDNTASFFVDETVIRSSGIQSIDGDITIVGDLNVTGNTIFTGNTSFVDIEHYSVTDPLIYLAANNYYSDIVAIGFAGNYFDGENELHTGLFRKPQSNTYYLFTGVTDELSANNEVTPTSNGFITATLVANIAEANVSNLVTAISPSDGGTGIRNYTIGDIIYASGETTLSKLSDIATGNVLLSGGVGSAPSYGKVGLSTHVSGILPTSNGGTNSNATPSAGSIAYGNGTSYLFNTAGTTGQSLISGGSGTPTFGTLDMRGGGLGFTSANANSAVFYSGTGNIMSYTNSASEGHVLQYSPETGISFGHINGGSF